MASEYSTSTTFDLRSQISSSSVGVHHASTAVQDVSMARASEVDHTTGDNLRLNALVVDDSLINRSILVRVLEKFGQFSEIIEVSTGHDAVRLCASKKFAIIFMDLEMPGMSGDEAAARIRSIGVTTPIVAVTGNVTRGDDINPLKQAGISEIVKKPVERQRVIDLCKSFIKFPIAVQQNQEKTGGARDSAVISVSKR
ncbi:CheY-like superfamily [Chytriomyces sp. MP71]|nr:CheY-like superfamily [Chytriomyces sp. MP71]